MNEHICETVSEAQSDIKEFLQKRMDQPSKIEIARLFYNEQQIKQNELEHALLECNKELNKRKKLYDMEWDKIEEYEENLRLALNTIHEYKKFEAK